MKSVDEACEHNLREDERLVGGMVRKFNALVKNGSAKLLSDAEPRKPSPLAIDSLKETTILILFDRQGLTGRMGRSYPGPMIMLGKQVCNERIGVVTAYRTSSGVFSLYPDSIAP